MDLYHYTGALLSNVWLSNGVERRNTKFGPGMRYADIDGLFRAITVALCLNTYRLNAESVRFLRKRLDLTQAELGAELGYTDGQIVAQWEKGEREIPVSHGRLLKLLALRTTAPELITADAVVDYRTPLPERLVFGYSADHGWQMQGSPQTTISVRHCAPSALPDFLRSTIGVAGRFNDTIVQAIAQNDHHYARHESKFAPA